MTCALGTSSGWSQPRAARPADGDRRPAVAGRDVCAHAPQGRCDTLHRPLHQGCIADQRRVERLPRQECRRAAASTCLNCRDRAASAGARSPRMPAPANARCPGPRRSCRTPIADSAASVEAQSSPSRKPWISVVPSAIAPSIAARCDIDLSPGTRTSPLTWAPGLVTKVRAAVFHAGPAIAVVMAASSRSFCSAVPVEMRR